MRFPSSLLSHLQSRLRLTNSRRSAAFYLAIVAALGICFQQLIIRGLSAPLICGLDTGVYIFSAFYFSENVSWWPVPRLDLVSDWSLFPYGVEHTFLHWSFERDALAGSLYAWWGPGPWLQLYALASVVGLAVAVFFVARRDLGALRAGFLGLTTTFFHLYCVFKFPGHIPYATVHWTILAILVDYLIVRRFVAREPISARLWALRLALLVLVLGLDLGYVAGYSLTSFVLTMAWLAVLQLSRHGLSPRRQGRIFVRWWGALRRSALRHRAQVAGLLMVTLGAAWLYVPLCLQLLRSVHRLPMPVMSATLWSSPLRIFLPFLPGIHPKAPGMVPRLEAFFGDHDSWVGAALSPGLWLTLLAALGLFAGRRRWPTLMPHLVLTAMLLAFHAEAMPTLRIFPWLAQARATDRASMVLPLLFALFATQLSMRWLRGSWRGRLVVGVLVLGAVEVVTGFAAAVERRNTAPSCMQPSAEFDQLMSTVRETPGRGLVEWPFAVLVGGGPLSSFGLLGGTGQFAQFHGKRQMSAHFGRMPPGSTQPMEAAGWQYLLLPTEYRTFQEVQRRDFVEEEWRFLEEFVRTADVAGLFVYVDFLPEATVRGFHQRFGPPAASAELFDWIGRVEFIPKPDAWRQHTDPEAALRLQLERPIFALELPARIQSKDPAINDYLFEGWSTGPRKLSTDGRPSLAFRLSESGPLTFRLDLFPWKSQRLRFELNGTVVHEVKIKSRAKQTVEFSVPAELLAPAGTKNLLVLDVPKRARRRTPAGWLELGVRLERLEVEAAKAAEAPPR